MVAGNLAFTRFPITLDLDAPADVTPQVGVGFTAFPSGTFDIIMPEVLPITGTGGKSKGAVVVFGREI